jgi:hypothetical protein
MKQIHKYMHLKKIEYDDSVVNWMGLGKLCDLFASTKNTKHIYKMF